MRDEQEPVTPAPLPPELARVLALQRHAGNARVARYVSRLQRATVGWKADGIAINKGSKTSGAFTRFPLDDLPTGLTASADFKAEEQGTRGWKSAAKHTTEKPYERGVVLIPTILLNNAPKEIDVLYHLHGQGIGWREGTKEADGKSAPAGFAFKGKVRDEVADDIAAQLPTTMAAVLPQGTGLAGFGGADPNAVIVDALHAVPGWQAVTPRRVLLGAYSGGGGALPGLIGSKKGRPADRIAERRADFPGLSEVAVFDAINGPNELRSMVAFVNDQIDADIAALTALADPAKQKDHLKSSMRFRGFYSTDSPDYNDLYPKLFNQTVVPKKLWKGNVEAKPQQHGTVPAKLAATIAQDVWELLADNYVIAPRGQGHATKVGGGNLKEAIDAVLPGEPATYPR